MHDNILNGTGLTGVPSPVNPAGGLPVSEFAPLIKITTNAATPFEESYVNIEANIKLHYPRLHELPEFMKPKGKDKPIFLVGAGPSLRKKDIFDELMGMYKEGHPIIACGASYDYLVENGVIPAYNSICDPDPITVNYLTKAHKATTFLLSTACAPSVLKRLIGYNIILWHCFSDANAEKFKELEPDFQAVGGGCTVGLRSVSIAIMLGYSNIHFFWV